MLHYHQSTGGYGGVVFWDRGVVFSHTKTKAVKLYYIRGASKLSLSDWRA